MKLPNWIERVVLRAQAMPLPFFHTHPDVLRSRAVMAGVTFGVFEALADEARTAAGVAEACGTDAGATRALLASLEACGYLRQRGEVFTLAPVARRWLLRSSATSLVDNVLWRYREWQWMGELDTFVQTGRPVDIHATMTDADWRLYQAGMRDLARVAAAEVARRSPLPARPQRVLDIGGAHNVYADALADRYPALHIDVLDLPAAHAAAPVPTHPDRTHALSADARTADLGDARYDGILIAQLVHHFDEATNRALIARCAESLKPGGVLVIQEFERGAVQRVRTRFAALGDLYFALTSASGLWTLDQIADWQRAAGLSVRRPVRLRRVPGLAQVVAVKE